MIILVTRDIGLREPQVAASLAAGFKLDLVSEEQLGQLVAERMQINVGNLQRLVACRASLFGRWLGEHRRLAWYTAEEISKLAKRGDVVVQSWNAVGSWHGIPGAIRVHIGQPRTRMHRAGARYSCHATISVRAAEPACDWGPSASQETERGAELVRAAAMHSVASCVQQLRQLALAPAGPSAPVTRGPCLPPLDDAAEPGMCTVRGSLLVEIGPDRMPLVGFSSSEQMIAQIEQHLHGKCADRRSVRQQLPLPPGIL